MIDARFLLAAILAGLLVVAMATDIRARIIPNLLNAAVALLAIGWWWAVGLSFGEVAVQVGIAAVVFALFVGCFAFGMMGGGDVKLIGALALWLPFVPLIRMLTIMAVAGGILTLVMLGLHRLARRAGQPEIPYGVAIAGAGLFVMANDIFTVPGA